MSARRLLGYVVKLPDGTRLRETPKPVHVAEAERLGARHAPAGSYLTAVFATRKPKLAPVAPAHPYGCARCYGFGHVWDGTVQVPCIVCRAAKPAPAEGAAPSSFNIPIGSTKTTFKFKGIVRTPAEDAAALAGTTSLGYPTGHTAEARAEARAYLGMEKSAPVAAAEGRYAVLFGDESGGHFGVLDKRGNEVAPRSVAADGGENKLYDGKLVRVLDDGAFEAACEAARREERARLCALFAPLFEMGASVAEIAEVVKTLDEAKEQGK